MRLYYHDRNVVVTSELFIRRAAPAAKFAIRDLRNVGISPDEADRLRPVSLLVTTAAVGAAGAVGVVVGPWTALAVLGMAGIAGVCGIVARRRRPRRLALSADYRGSGVTLWSYSDERVFNQVARALRRAIEDQPPSSWDDRTAA